MSQITRSALVPFSAEQMYELVNDVLSYPEFLPWCKSSAILKEGTNWMEAELTVHKGAFTQSFTTRNEGVPGVSLQMELTNNSGAFKKLKGQWLFKALASDSCKIEFSLELELGSSPLGLVLKPLFNSIATTMVEAFSQRAKKIYPSPALRATSPARGEVNQSTALVGRGVKVEVVYCLPNQQTLVSLEVPEGSTVREVIIQSGILQSYPEIDLSKNKVGIFSKIMGLDGKIKAMDRIEIYRPLTIDPMDARRLRAPKKKLATQRRHN